MATTDVDQIPLPPTDPPPQPVPGEPLPKPIPDEPPDPSHKLSSVRGPIRLRRLQNLYRLNYLPPCRGTGHVAGL